MRILTLRGRLTECKLENAAEASHFTTFALFSPNGRLLLTAGGADGRLQLWRAPTDLTRAYELRQLTTREHSIATCAAFAPDGGFVAVGTQDRQVLVWPLPSVSDIERQVTGQLTLVEQAVDTSSRQVRVWAEVNNQSGLLPGSTVTLTAYPR